MIYLTQMLVQNLPLAVTQQILFTLLVCVQKETLLCHPHIVGSQLTGNHRDGEMPHKCKQTLR